MPSVLLLAAPAEASWRRFRVADPAATLRRANALRASFGARLHLDLFTGLPPARAVRMEVRPAGVTLRRAFTGS